MDGDKYVSLIKSRLSEKRFIHSMNAAKAAVSLARKYSADEQKAYTAGVLHDICKEETAEKQLQFIEESGTILDNISAQTQKLWHAKSGAAYIKVYLGVTDPEILNAVSYHTTARAGMSLLEKIIYLADYIGEERDYDGVEQMRIETQRSLEDGLRFALSFTICDLVERKRKIHPDTLGAYNEVIGEK